MGYYDRDSLSYAGFDQKDQRVSVSTVIPVGQGVINVGYERGKLTATAPLAYTNTISKFAVGYIYNLSKRTAVYSQVARLSNGSRSAAQIGGDTGGSGAGAPPVAGGKSTGFEFGLRHFF